MWHDSPVSGRVMNIILGLLRKIELLEAEVESVRMKERKGMMLLVVLMIVVLIVFCGRKKGTLFVLMQFTMICI